jgi:Zn-dependent protease with chaperone function
MMVLQSAYVVAVLSVAAFAYSFAAATVVVEWLGGSWRRAERSHWTERARAAYAPGFGVLWLAAVLPPATALVGDLGISALTGQMHSQALPFWTVGCAAIAGVLLVRYRWLRGLWGARVTAWTWFAGCLVALMALAPHLAILVVLLFLMPQTADWRAAAILGAGILAVAAFACGAGVQILRWLVVVRRAPGPLEQMVTELAREMNVPGRVKVFLLEWPQVNAVAWGLYRAVGFSRPLLEIMNADELRAIAAHELAHLTESKQVRGVRIAQMFAYLPAVPLIRYGGTAGTLAGELLILAVFVSYKRFTHSLEKRADHVEREAIANPAAYARSLIKLHEANLLPAVMPGHQSHPHLYDRLLAGGVQPDFPRPLPPARGKMLLAVMVMMLMVLMLMCFTIIAMGVVIRIAHQF